jgi:hypothetical protein
MLIQAMFRIRITDLFDEQGIAYRLLSHDEPAFNITAAARQRGVVEEELEELWYSIAETIPCRAGFSGRERSRRWVRPA